jgi:hypothetical protein
MTGYAEAIPVNPTALFTSGWPTIRPELLLLPKSRFLVHELEINIRVATVRLERLGRQLCPRSAESFGVLRPVHPANQTYQIKEARHLT